MATKNAPKSARNIRVPESLVKAIVALVRPYIHGADEETVQQAICSLGQMSEDNQQPSEKLLKRKQVAEMLCVSPRTVDRFITDGTLKRVSLHGMVRIPQQSVQQLMSNN